MSDKRSRKIRKYCLIWTLITAVLISAYSTGLYCIYKKGMDYLKPEVVLFTNVWNYVYNNSHNMIVKSVINQSVDNCDYYYFGKIEDDGSLTDIYKTDYDCFVLSSNDVMFRQPYSDVNSMEYILTNDPDKQGKVERSSYTYKNSYDNTMVGYYERHFLTCPEDVFDKLKSAQSSGKYIAWYYAFNQEDNILDNDAVFTHPDNGSEKKYRTYAGAVLAITDFLTNYKEDSLYADDYGFNRDYDRACIYNAGVDVEAGKILSGELMINGDVYSFPTDNSTDTESVFMKYLGKYIYRDVYLDDNNTKISVSMHKRPDSILENNKELLRDNFDRSYLEGLKYESVSDLYKEMYWDYSGDEKSIKGFTYDLKFEDGQAVVSGICKYKDGYYRYVYIRPYAGFFEAFAPCILEVMLKVWIPGLIVAALLGAAVSRKRY